MAPLGFETIMDNLNQPAHRCTGDLSVGVPRLLYFVEPLTRQKQTEVFAWGWPPALPGGPGGACTAFLKVLVASPTPQPHFLGASAPVGEELREQWPIAASSCPTASVPTISEGTGQGPTDFTTPASGTKGGPRGSYNHTAVKPELDRSPRLDWSQSLGKVDSRKTRQGGRAGRPRLQGSQMSWSVGPKMASSAKVF